ncbi:glutaredoxin 3 [Aurantivibrio plasticivorans]
MEPALVYSSDMCGYCVAAKRLLEQQGIPYQEINVSREPAKRLEMMERSGRRTVPQIFFGDEHIGGFTDLQAYFAKQRG